MRVAMRAHCLTAGKGVLHNNAVADLGRPDEIGGLFSGFQRYLYQPTQSGSQQYGFASA